MPWQTPKALTLTMEQGCRDKTKQNKKGPNERTEQNLRNRTRQGADHQPDGEFKALVIKMLTDLIEVGRKMKKQVKKSK